MEQYLNAIRVASEIRNEIKGTEPRIIQEQYRDEMIQKILGFIKTEEDYNLKTVLDASRFLEHEFEVISEKVSKLKIYGTLYQFEEKILTERYEMICELMRFLLEARVCKFLEANTEFDKRLFLMHTEEMGWSELVGQLRLMKCRYNNLKQIHEIVFQVICPTGIEPYLQFFSHAWTITQFELNRKNRNPSAKIYIEPQRLKKAKLYFFECTTEQDLNRAIREWYYKRNRSFGLKGEIRIARVVDKLKGKYSIIEPDSQKMPGVKLFDKKTGRFTEFDQILVGPSGVIVIEVKDFACHKLVFSSDGQLIKESKGHLRAVKNPCDQLDVQTQLIRDIVGDDIPVKTLLVVVNPYILLEGQERFPFPVIKADRLTTYLNESSKDTLLTPEQMENVISAISKKRFRR